MRRNMALIRRILLFIEGSEDSKIFTSDIAKAIHEHPPREVAHHWRLAWDAEFIAITTEADEAGFNRQAARLTMKGHDFLSIVRNSDAWNTVRTLIKKKTGDYEVPVDVLIPLMKNAQGISVSAFADFLVKQS